MTKDEQFDLANEIADEHINGRRLGMQEALRLVTILANSEYWPVR